MAILGLAPLRSQKHGNGPRRQRGRMRSRIAKRCRGIGTGCAELVVRETVEEPADGVWGTFPVCF